MILIFHGDNITASQSALDQFIASKTNYQTYRFDSKEVNPNNVNLILNSTSLLDDKKLIIFYNLFSTPKVTLDKLIPLLNSTTEDVCIWQDKVLTATQLKVFPQAKVSLSKADNFLYKSLNSITPHNISNFCQTYQKVIDENMFDLYLYLLKGSLRRQLSTFSKFPLAQLQKTYLQVIELEYLYKSGQLTLSKDIALQRIILNLIK